MTDALAALIPSLIGAASNYANQAEQNSDRRAIFNRQMALEKNYEAAGSPAAVSAGTLALEQPLSKDLTNTVEREAIGQLAERGYSGAPGLMSKVIAEALAPYLLRQQETAQQAYFQGKGLPVSVGFPASPGFPGKTNAFAPLANAIALMLAKKGTPPKALELEQGQDADLSGTPPPVEIDQPTEQVPSEGGDLSGD